MTPEEMKGKLDEVDAKLRAALAANGFTPEEIDRQMDPSVPAAQKEAEREVVLRRSVVAQMSDPESPLFQAAIREVERTAGEKLEALAQADRARRRKRVLGAIAGTAVIAAAVWWFVLRDTRSRCEKLLPPRADIAAISKLALSPDVYARANGDHDCSASYSSPAVKSHPAVTIYWEKSGRLDDVRRQQTKRPFAGHELVQTALGPADVFVAGPPQDDVKGPSPEEMLAQAEARVGKSRDPIGDVLASTPPSSPESHVVVVRDDAGVIHIDLDRTAFTADQAKAFAKMVAER